MAENRKETLVLDRFFRPVSSAISHVGYHPLVGVVVRYHSGFEYVIYRSTWLLYLELLETPSVGAHVAFLKANNQYRLLRWEGASHFPVEDRWLGHDQAHRTNIPEQERRWRED